MPSLSFIIDSGILVVTDSIEIPASLLQLETFSLSIIDTASYARERDILQFYSDKMMLDIRCHSHHSYANAYVRNVSTDSCHLLVRSED